MTQFRYTAMTLGGRLIAGEAEAADAAAMASTLEARGLVPMDVKPIRMRIDRGWFVQSVDQRKVTAFLADFALMLRGGQTIDAALDLISEEMDGPLGRALRKIRSELMAGTSLVDALKRQPHVFGPEIVAMMQMSEATGRLDRALGALAAQRGRLHKLTEKLSGALRYAALMLALAVAVFFFFLLHVIPQFATVLNDAGPAAKTGLIGTVLWISTTVRDNIVWIGAGAGALVILGIVAARLASVRLAAATALSRLPIVRGVVMLNRTTLFCSNLGTMLDQGVELVQALKVLETTAGLTARNKIVEIGDMVRQGSRFSHALEQTQVLPKIATRMLKIGEDTGELPAVATQVGLIYEQHLERRFERIAAIVGPAAIVLIASMVGGIMALILSTLISINQLVL
jgi:general secretion pathway protein F